MASKVRASVFTIFALFLGTATVSAQGSAESPNPLNIETDANKGTVSDSIQYLDRTGEPVVFRRSFRPDFLHPDGIDDKALRLTVLNAANAILEKELEKGISEFDALAGVGLVMNINNGEIIALASDTSQKTNYAPEINRAMKGVFENLAAGKLITMALALDSERFSLNSRINAKEPLQIGRHRISDANPQNRELSVQEVFQYSSNIGSARIVSAFTPEQHYSFFQKLGMVDSLSVPLLGYNEPILPRGKWTELNSATISFGHGMAVSPLHASVAISSLLNGGKRINPTIVQTLETTSNLKGEQVVSAKTSELVRYLFRMNAEKGSAKVADIKGYFAGGVASTANKVVNGYYSDKKVLTNFVSAFPIDKPQYLLMVILDEPKDGGPKKVFRLAPFNAGVISGRIIPQIAELMGIEHREIAPTNPFPEVKKASNRRASLH